MQLNITAFFQLKARYESIGMAGMGLSSQLNHYMNLIDCACLAYIRNVDFKMPTTSRADVNKVCTKLYREIPHELHALAHPSRRCRPMCSTKLDG
jgi:hypothetical protein